MVFSDRQTFSLSHNHTFLPLVYIKEWEKCHTAESRRLSKSENFSVLGAGAGAIATPHCTVVLLAML
ncbi:hypothetical protein F7734_58540 [Scytonema sp. UIC 10036]|uniref:hypothetical protein n=1 Tax=Scytonema sp. UIC 10036 TaxID=2304196 RepID=UPI0012DADF9A|nr:hypothetical protein [Scytonema sp. UIC 10036]MUH01547.1 hypothetical protein [Scytonema sp. UIC 10036]